MTKKTLEKANALLTKLSFAKEALITIEDAVNIVKSMLGLNIFSDMRFSVDDIANKKQGQYYNNRHNESDGIPY